MAKSRSRGKHGKPQHPKLPIVPTPASGAEPADEARPASAPPTDAAPANLAGADADRTQVLPPADPDPTLVQPADASAPADAPRPLTEAGAASTGKAEETKAVVPAKAEETKPAKVELKGSLRSKKELQAREKARGKGAKPESARVDIAGAAWEWIKSLGAAVLLFLVIRTFIITAYSIPSESMEETLLVGDYLMANNALFGATIPFTDIKLPALRDPHRGEIVVFRPTYNEPQIDVVKRVVGEPGDTLQMVDKVLFRNGERVDEPYAHYDQGFDEPIGMEGFGLMDPNIRPEAYGAKNHLDILLPPTNPRQYQPSRNNWGPLVIPAGHYWLMGDNRDQSLDSRYMGPIPRRVIRGKPLFIYYSYDKRALEAAFPRFVTAARWSRIGDRIR